MKEIQSVRGSCWLNRAGSPQAVSIEREGANFAGSALSGNILAAEHEIEPRSISSFDDDFVAGANRRVCGRDQGFVRDGLTVGADRDPGSLVRADDEGESRLRLGSGWARVRLCEWRVHG